jgi:hypothetical protein
MICRADVKFGLAHGGGGHKRIDLQGLRWRSYSGRWDRFIVLMT